MPSSDEVGYRRPPASSRFQPGQSGNPGGRPKRIPSVTADLIDELATEKDGVTRQRAILRMLVAEALRGDAKAAQIVLRLAAALPTNTNDDDQEEHRLTEDYLEKEVQRRLALREIKK